MTHESLRQGIGRRVREIRTAHGRSQEHLADAARRVGLAWDRSRIAGLERGGKALSADELVRLPLLLALAGCGSPVLADLLPDSAGWLDLDSRTRVQATLARAVLSGVAHPPGVLVVDGATPLGFTLPGFGVPAAGGSAHGGSGADVESRREVERAAAARIGVTPEDVVRVSHMVWGHGLTEERDKRAKAAGRERARVTPAMDQALIEALRQEQADEVSEPR